MSAAALPRPGSAGAWWLAARPRTLPAALAPIAAGTGAAAAEGRADPGLALACLATALLLQLAANLANDLYDHERGADTAGRLGPARAAASGLLSPGALRAGLGAALVAAAASGLVLVARGGWPVALAGSLALLAAWAYTGGPWPLAYHGLGDAAVFVFFGVVGVAGSHGLQAGAASPLAFAAAVPLGLLATAILAINNLRDREGDARAGKRTLAVRLGARRARRYTVVLLRAPFWLLAPVAFVAGSAWALAPIALAPRAGRLAAAIAGGLDGPALDPALAATARLTAGFGVLLGAGLALAGAA
ncbi:MAG: 1,4-dihydroxy-2-naphthoate polyprenyltransferase [Deltaproteobacteria bacterium]|nr:1,4-dihydroxy-2-naphthoate polyprenyltransferase [Deltaproteobacteria bacterium]